MVLFESGFQGDELFVIREDLTELPCCKFDVVVLLPLFVKQLFDRIVRVSVFKDLGEVGKPALGRSMVVIFSPMFLSREAVHYILEIVIGVVFRFVEELVYVVLIEVSVQQRELIVSRGNQLYRPALQNLVIDRVAVWL